MTTATPPEALDLDAIEANAQAYPPGALLTAKRCIPDGQIQHGCVISSGERVKEALRAAFQATHKDVPRLVAEVRRTRGLLAEHDRLQEIGDDLREQLILEGAIRALVFAAEFFGDPAGLLSNYAGELRSGKQTLPKRIGEATE